MGEPGPPRPDSAAPPGQVDAATVSMLTCPARRACTGRPKSGNENRCRRERKGTAMTAEEQTAIPWNGLPPSRQSCQPSTHQQDTHQLVTLLKRTRKPMPSRQLPVTRKSWNRRSSGAASNSARRRKSSRPGQRRRPEHGTRQLSCPGASRARQVRHGRRPPPALPARAVSSLARLRRPVRKPWPSAALGKASCRAGQPQWAPPFGKPRRNRCGGPSRRRPAAPDSAARR
jgi:hypothetical protein